MDSCLHEEAVKFLDEVEKAFFCTNDYGNKLDLFLSALKTHNDGAISTEALVKTIKNLLEGHGDLLSWYTNKFAPKFAQTQTSDLMEIDDHEKVNVESGKRKCSEFLRKVNERFEDDAVTYSKVLDALNEKNGIKLVYTELCTLLLGHADLFREFDSLMKFDTSEKTRLELQNVLLNIAEDVMYDVDLEVEQYRLTIKAVKEGAKKLSAVHYRCIESIGKKGLLNDFVRKMKEDPRRVCKAVLPHLEEKERELLLTKRSVRAFFRDVFSIPTTYE